MPEEVSLWVTVSTSYLPVESAASTISAVVGSPITLSNLSAGIPLVLAILNHLSPKAPMENTAARLAVQERMAPSMRPEPEEVESRMRFSVKSTFCMLSEMRFWISEAFLERCPIIGRHISLRMSSDTTVGPGMNSLIAITGVGVRLFNSGILPCPLFHGEHKIRM